MAAITGASSRRAARTVSIDSSIFPDILTECPSMERPVTRMQLSVTDLAQPIQFYETLFGAPPVVRNEDYAKWMLDDPRVNFAVSLRDQPPGLTYGEDPEGPLAAVGAGCSEAARPPSTPAGCRA
jgi:hypothetical protein